MFAYDVKKSVEDAKKDAAGYNKGNFRMLLKIYQLKVDAINKQYNGIESDIPYDSEYFILKNKYQYVLNLFTKE